MADTAPGKTEVYGGLLVGIALLAVGGWRLTMHVTQGAVLVGAGIVGILYAVLTYLDVRDEWTTADQPRPRETDHQGRGRGALPTDAPAAQGGAAGGEAPPEPAAEQVPEVPQGAGSEGQDRAPPAHGQEAAGPDQAPVPEARTAAAAAPPRVPPEDLPGRSTVRGAKVLAGVVLLTGTGAGALFAFPGLIRGAPDLGGTGQVAGAAVAAGGLGFAGLLWTLATILEILRQRG